VIGIPAVLFVVALIAVAARGGPAPATPGAANPATSEAGGAGLGQSGLFGLKPGDCFESVPLPADGSSVGVGSVQPLPCTSPHTRQAVTTLAYPGVTWEGGGEAKSTEACTSAMTTDLRKEIRADSDYKPAILHMVVTSPSKPDNLYVVCVIATEAPKTGSALR
jgi:hypothetical protein